jgi:hypothetical protein
LDGVGIVVDPGINFIKNAVSCGLSLKDIDAIVLTHSHVDHTSDFEGLVTLFHEMNTPRYDVGLDPIRFSLYASIGAMNKYCNLISISYDLLKNVVVMNPRSTYPLSDSVSMNTTTCQHNDLFCVHPSSCVGLKFYCGGKLRPVIAITSDTGYSPQLQSEFADLKGNPVILHIGGIEEKEIESAPPPNVPLYKFHLGLRGVINFVFDVKPSVAIISEFGEEFRETRKSISDLLQKEFSTRTKVIPADVGFTIEFTDQKPYALVPCAICHSRIPVSNIQTKQQEKGQSLTYLCRSCSKK